jgi:hypothetical protein
MDVQAIATILLARTPEQWHVSLITEERRHFKMKQTYVGKWTPIYEKFGNLPRFSGRAGAAGLPSSSLSPAVPSASLTNLSSPLWKPYLWASL